MQRNRNDVDCVFGPDGHTSYTVTFSRVEKDFFVKLPAGVVVRDPSCEGAKRAAKEALKKLTRYEWVPVIVVDIESSYDDFMENAHGFNAFGTRLNFSFDRLEVAQHPLDPKVKLQRSHPIDFEATCKRLMSHQVEAYRKDRDDPGRKHEEFRSDGTVLPYSEMTWQGLLGIKRAVDETRDRLDALMKRPDFGKMLQAAMTKGIPLLGPAGEPKRRTRRKVG